MAKDATRLSLSDYQGRLLSRLHDPASARSGNSVLQVRIGKEDWLVALDQVREVMPATSVLRVPHAPAWLLGLTALRGELYGVADPLVLLGRISRAATDRPFMLFLAPLASGRWALNVDQVTSARQRAFGSDPDPALPPLIDPERMLAADALDPSIAQS